MDLSLIHISFSLLPSDYPLPVSITWYRPCASLYLTICDLSLFALIYLTMSPLFFSNLLLRFFLEYPTHQFLYFIPPTYHSSPKMFRLSINLSTTYSYLVRKLLSFSSTITTPFCFSVQDTTFYCVLWTPNVSAVLREGTMRPIPCISVLTSAATLWHHLHMAI